jgi:protoporphyrinogen oxidase
VLVDDERQERAARSSVAGPWGSPAAYELLKAGWAVDLYERDDRIGGMSASTEIDGLKIERYYHFICKPDATTFEYLRELGIADKLRWVDTKMGFYYGGRLTSGATRSRCSSSPGSTSSPSCATARTPLRHQGLATGARSTRWAATPWLKKWVGERALRRALESLFELKFFEYKDSLSAAWLGTRIKRVALSRKSMFQERLATSRAARTRCSTRSRRRIRGWAGNPAQSGRERIEIEGAACAASAWAASCGPTTRWSRRSRCRTS